MGNSERSITKLEDSEPIEFLIENAGDYFLGLRQSYLNIKLRVVNSDDSNLAADTKAGLIIHPTAFFFSKWMFYLMAT